MAPSSTSMAGSSPGDELETGPVRRCRWSLVIELRRTRQLQAVSAPRSVHTGGKSEAQLTKKQAVLLMHDTLPQGVKSIRALL